MFRKISAAAGKRPKKAVRKRTIDDEDDDNEDDGTGTGAGSIDVEGGARTNNLTTAPMTTQQQIQYTKKKRKLLTNLQYKRGLDTNQLLQVQQQNNPNHSNNHSDNAETDSADADVEPDPLTTPASSSAAEQGSQEGVLESKHKQAMESYIQQKMKLGAANAKEAANWSNNNNNNVDMDMDKIGNETTEHEIRQHATTLTKEQLYRELAVAAARLAGKSDNSNFDGNNKNTNASDSTKDGDVGAGGAMLVAGTGIAEVILPVDERLKTHQDTNESVQARNQLRGKNKNAAAAAKSRNTSSTATGSNRPSAVPNRFFVPNTMASFPQSRDAQAAAAAATSSQQQSAYTSASTNAVDDERLGFDAVKRQREGSGAGASSYTQQSGQRSNSNSNPPSGQQQSSSSSSNQQRNSRSSDDRVFRKFVSRQRDAQMRDKK
jgi:hypothetical protein